MDIQKKSIKNHIACFETDPEKFTRKPDLVEFDGRHYAIKGSFFQKIKLRARVFLYKVRQKSTSYLKTKALNQLLRQLDMKTDSFLQRIAKGENFIGKVVFAFLDIIPLPNFHEIMKKVNKEYPDASIPEKIKIMFQKVDWVRTLTAIVGAVLIALEYIEPGTLTLLIQ